MTAGPTAAIAALLPTKRPAPMIPPSEIIVTWRDCRPRLRPLLSVSSGTLLIDWPPTCRSLPRCAPDLASPARRRISTVRLMYSGERREAGLRAAENQRVDVVGTNVRVHRFQVAHVSHHVELVADAVAAVDVARFA